MNLSKIREILEPVITGLGYSLYDLEFGEEFGEPTLTVLVDSNVGPMDLDMILELSEAIGNEMDKNENVISGAYNLNVASAGAERKISGADQFKINKGKHVNVEVQQEIDGVLIFQGDLIEVDDSKITIEYKFKTRMKKVEIKYEEIVAARTAVKF